MFLGLLETVFGTLLFFGRFLGAYLGHCLKDVERFLDSFTESGEVLEVFRD